jgi:hypothetical protein
MRGKAVGPVDAPTRDQAHAVGITPDHEAVTVMLDLVQPNRDWLEVLRFGTARRVR